MSCPQEILNALGEISLDELPTLVDWFFLDCPKNPKTSRLAAPEVMICLEHESNNSNKPQ